MITKDKLLNEFVEARIKDVQVFPNPDATKVVRRGNIFFALDEVTGKLVVYKQRKLLKSEKQVREFHTDTAFTRFYDDNEILKISHVDIPKKFIKVMKAKGTHPILVEAAEKRIDTYGKSCDERREAALQKFSEIFGQTVEDVLKWYNVRLSKKCLVVTLKPNLTKDDLAFTHKDKMSEAEKVLADSPKIKLDLESCKIQ